ncbi:MAG: DNA translocase FtsK 4TM domain-containing protein [Deltaproteobacteria bacterium]|nr:DNA translocase FtsK 4TM domain-containing protein [Deltaproteobacteria bacterium]
MPKRRSRLREDSSDFIVREIIAAILFTVGVFTSLSLLFYSSKSGLDVKGTMGTVGVFISDLLGDTFGLSALLIPIVMFYTAVVVFTSKFGGKLYRNAISAFILLFMIPTILGLIFGKEAFLGYSPPGGWIGSFISTTLRNKIAGTVGSYIIVTIFLVMSLIIMSNLSLYQILSWSGKVLMLISDGITYLSKSGLRLGERIIEGSYDLFSKLSRLGIEVAKPASDKKEAPFSPLFQEKPKPIVENKPLPQIVVEVPRREIQLKLIQHTTERANFKLPPVDLLDPRKDSKMEFDKEAIYEKARLTEEKLAHLGVSGKITEIRPGPVITMFEYKPDPGIKINKIASLENDLAMGLSALSIRIIAPIPGKDVIGIEVPNVKRETVVLRELLEDPEFSRRKSILTLALGRDISGMPFYMDLRKSPHLMIAGTTGSGKSVLLHSVITSMLYKASPYELKFIMVDPKMLELSIYEDIPHLLHPVVTEPKKAATALSWAVAEMEKRYRTLSYEGVRDVESYNRNVEKLQSQDKWQKWLPYIVIVIDELADLMMVAPRDVGESITRLSQKARAAGIHLIVATQRPSVDIVAGLIKANFPARISFHVSSKIDSRIILDAGGAERLLGKGDMLFLQPGTSKLTRIQCGLISDGERERITEFLKAQGTPEYNQEITKIEESEESNELDDEKDEFYYEALRIIKETRHASISMIQRKLKIGYNRAARIVEIMEKEGLIGPQEVAGKPREVLIGMDQIKEKQGN